MGLPTLSFHVQDYGHVKVLPIQNFLVANLMKHKIPILSLLPIKPQKLNVKREDKKPSPVWMHHWVPRYAIAGKGHRSSHLVVWIFDQLWPHWPWHGFSNQLNKMTKSATSMQLSSEMSVNHTNHPWGSICSKCIVSSFLFQSTQNIGAPLPAQVYFLKLYLELMEGESTWKKCVKISSMTTSVGARARQSGTRTILYCNIFRSSKSCARYHQGKLWPRHPEQSVNLSIFFTRLCSLIF